MVKGSLAEAADEDLVAAGELYQVLESILKDSLREESKHRKESLLVIQWRRSSQNILIMKRGLQREATKATEA